VLSIVMTAIAHLKKVVVSDDPETVDFVLYETWTEVEDEPGPLTYETWSTDTRPDAAGIITELEGRADIEYV